MRIAIAGASGFVGKALTLALAKDHRIVALSRRAPTTKEQFIPDGPGITFVQANLFSLIEVEQALADVDLAIYLVHSMMPPSRLTQGTFENLDVILADNFARAAQKQGVKRIVYLSGIIPDGKLSPHLASRLEVEQVLSNRGVPVVTLRAGLIVGAFGSSFTIMEKLVRRLPVMVCPAWTDKKCQPIAVEDVVELMKHVVKDEDLPAGAYDIGGQDKLSYVEMMQRTAHVLNLKRKFIRVNVVSPRLSKLWVSVVTGTPRALVYPLVESLRHSMIARDVKLQLRYGLSPMTFDQSLRTALSKEESAEQRSYAVPRNSPELNKQSLKQSSTVISVQRLPLPEGKDAKWVAQEYARWLPAALYPFVYVERSKDDSLSLKFRPLGYFGPQVHLMQLEFSSTRSSKTRELFYIAGGSLLRPDVSSKRGRLEFRLLPESKEVMAAVLEYRPRLKWWVYKWTQANLHLLVMTLFQRHLRASLKAEAT